MKIVLDATSIRDRPSGIGIYIQNLLTGMLEILREDDQIGFDLRILHKNKILWKFLNNQFLENQVKASHLLRFQGFYYPFPSEVSLQILRRSQWIKFLFENFLGKPDIFHGLDYLNYPLKHSYNILTLHDLSFIRYPQYAADRVLKLYQKRLEICFQWTDLIIAVSESTKQDIVNFFGINPEKIWVTPLASRYTPIPIIPLNFPFPYLLFVSTLEPRKNINTLVQAFEILKQKYKIPHHLILIGKKGWKYTAILETIESSPVQNCIHQLDYLDDRQLVQFYQQATAFLYPSYYEGFGLPVLEAMTLGIPVITSNQSSLPEVTGDAALLVHPEDVDSLVSATRSVIDNPDLHRHLSQAGRERSLLFSWKKTALQTLAAYKSLL
jgi:glycosyltransferase involved in cell wall biosynthesis